VVDLYTQSTAAALYTKPRRFAATPRRAALFARFAGFLALATDNPPPRMKPTQSA